jgi:hypothetical protein
MKDISDISPSGKKSARTACRVAYTLNNAQPVACTIIGDQPLFYMDFNGDVCDEDFLFDASDAGILDKEITALKDEIAALEKVVSESAQTTEERVAEFFDCAADIVRTQPQKPAIATLESLHEILGKSRLAQAYLEHAAKHNVTIQFSRQTEMAFYDRKAGKIFINPGMDFTDMILLSVRELRRHWQHRNGALINPLTFHPDNAVLVNRAQVADLSVSIIRAAWELQLSGHRDAWKRLETSTLADLTRSFAREAFLDFRTINNGQAAAAVFESWFLSERCRQQDKTLIQQMLADYQGYVFDIDQALQAVTPNLIAALGSMPYGKNYLAEHASTIMNDPVFTDVRDRSNANFLWFIKFERSFKETEQELQTEEGQAAEGILPKAKPSFSKDLKQEAFHGAKSAEIVKLFGNTPAKPAARKASVRGGKVSAEIVYLRRSPGEPG